MNKSNRTLSLEWWRSLNQQQKNEVVNKWKQSLPNTDSKKSWDIILIEMSSSTIQIIWESNAK